MVKKETKSKGKQSLPITKNLIRHFLNNKDEVHCETKTIWKPPTPFEIDASEFIKYAELDLSSKLTHKYVNGLSNTKRALHCRCDLLFYIFGLYKKTKRWNFPTKLNVLKKIGIVSPGIINKINKSRNLLEHEYKRPSPDEVEEAYEIVELFLESTKYILKGWSKEIEFERDYSKGYSELKLLFDYRNKELIIHLRKVRGKKSQDYKGCYSFSTDDYIEILSIFGKVGFDIFIQ